MDYHFAGIRYAFGCTCFCLGGFLSVEKEAFLIKIKQNGRQKKCFAQSLICKMLALLQLWAETLFDQFY